MKAIKSNKDLLFSLTSNKKGKLTIEIDLFQVNSSNWFFRLKDSVEYTVKETQNVPVPTLPNELPKYEQKEVDVVKIESVYREKTYPSEKINALAQALNVNITGEDFTDQLDTFMRKGLLLLTQLECSEAQEKGELGIYLSEAQDWEEVSVETNPPVEE